MEEREREERRWMDGWMQGGKERRGIGREGKGGNGRGREREGRKERGRGREKKDREYREINLKKGQEKY